MLRAATLGLLLAASAAHGMPGFVADAEPNRRLEGRWINQFLFEVSGQAARSFWQVVDFGDTVITHEYFSRDPRIGSEIPYTTVVSSWATGSYNEPGDEGQTLPVIRLQPLALINYDRTRERFTHITGNYAPQFRRFALSSDGDRLDLSELVVLEVPGDRLLSFPENAGDMTFRPFLEPPTAVHETSWGQLKARRQRRR